MKRRKLMIWAAVSMTAVALAYAGLEHSGGKTYWTDKPTPATHWLRIEGNIDVLETTSRVFVYDNTPTILYTSTSDQGFWTNDAGIVEADVTIGPEDCTTNRGALGDWTDVEWNIDGDGILFAKD